MTDNTHTNETAQETMDKYAVNTDSGDSTPDSTEADSINPDPIDPAILPAPDPSFAQNSGNETAADTDSDSGTATTGDSDVANQVVRGV